MLTRRLKIEKISTLLVIFIAVFFVFSNKASAEWSPGWSYRKEISLTGQSGAGTSFQVKLLIGESSGASGANFHIEGNSADFPAAKNDGGDLFFTDNDGSTALSFWVENVSGVAPNRTATIWVKVADDLNSNGTIYCYYGNSSASNLSNGNNTFILFDDFDGVSLDTNKWTQHAGGDGSLSVNNSQITFHSWTNGTDYVWVNSNNNYTYPVWSETNLDSFSNDSNATYRLGQTTGVTPRIDNGNMYNNYSVDATGTSEFRIVGDNASGGWSVSSTSIGGLTSGLWSFAWIATGNQKFFFNYSQKLSGSNANNSISNYYMYFGHASDNAGTSIVDWARIRKYNATEPSFATSSSQEASTDCLSNNFAGGDGSLDNPYQISTLNQLGSVKNCLTSNFIQTADIDASATSTWNGGAGFTPIGDGTTQFSGTYDGNDHSIDGLTVNLTGNYKGLFGYISGSEPYTAWIKDLSINNADIDGTYMMGVLAGRTNDTLISGCYVSGTVTSDAISLSDWTNAGGLIGRANQTKVFNSGANVAVTALGYRNGGLVAQIWDDGTNSSQIINSYALGNVVGGSSYGGGLVGIMDGGTISNCYARGDVTRSNGASVTTFGGFIGGNYGNIPSVSNSFSTGSVYYDGSAAPTTKGFSGETLNNSNNFFDSETSNQSSSSGATAKTTAQMKTQSTFTDATWDFTSIWVIDGETNAGYPYLQQLDQYTLTYNAATGGSISGDTSQTVYSGEDGSAVTAVPNTGYSFINWSDESTANPRTDTNISANLTVTANFNINSYTVTFKDYDDSTLKTESVNYGSAATAPADPTRTGYVFTGWSVAFDNITTDLAITAQYTLETFTLSYSAGTGGSISGSVNQTVDYGTDGTAVEAVANNGYAFSSWSDESTANPRTDTNISANITVSAIFNDILAPTISTVRATPTADSVEITWTTNENSTSQVQYGLTSALGSTTIKDETLTDNHNVNISSLHSCARYYCKIVSEDVDSNSTVSNTYTFSTLGCNSSSIENGEEESLTATGGTLSVNTNQGSAALDIPSNFYSDNGTPKAATFQINKLDTEEAPNAPSGKTLNDDNFFDLLAVSEDGIQITTFDQNITFTISYNEETESNFDETTLEVYKYTGNDWEAKNCTVDTDTNIITCSLPSFSTYGLFGEEVQSTPEPTEDIEEVARKADISKWEAYLYDKPGSDCPTRLRLKIKGDHFDNEAKVEIGNKKAYSVEVKKDTLIARFCMKDLLKVKTDLKRSISVTNPEANKKKAKKKIDLGKVTYKMDDRSFDISNSDRILNIQRALAALGFLDWQYTTGYYGTITSDAISKFQAENSLPVTGDFDHQTQTKLIGALN